MLFAVSRDVSLCTHLRPVRCSVCPSCLQTKNHISNEFSQFSSVRLLSRVRHFATPRITAPRLAPGNTRTTNPPLGLGHGGLGLPPACSRVTGHRQGRDKAMAAAEGAGNPPGPGFCAGTKQGFRSQLPPGRTRPSASDRF